MTWIGLRLLSIVKGELPASVRYSDDEIMAFMDIRPVNPSHMFVTPRPHTAHLADLEPKRGQGCSWGICGSLRASGGPW